MEDDSWSFELSPAGGRINAASSVLIIDSATAWRPLPRPRGASPVKWSAPPSESALNSSTPLLVLGATSLIGRFLPAVAGDRPLFGFSRVARQGVSYAWTHGDLGDPAVELPRVEAVVALCPIWLLQGALPALARAGVRRVVAVSSTSRWTKLASPDAGEREVAQRLADGEAALERFAAERGWNATVLRPTLIYAEGQDRNVSRLAELAARWGVLPLAGDGRGLRQPVHAQDLAAGVLAALDHPATYGRAYDLPGGETLSYRVMAVRIFEALGRPPRLISVPPFAWRAGLRLAKPWLPGVTGAMGERMAADLTFDPVPATRDFGWRPRPFRPDFGGGRA